MSLLVSCLVHFVLMAVFVATPSWGGYSNSIRGQNGQLHAVLHLIEGDSAPVLYKQELSSKRTHFPGGKRGGGEADEPWQLPGLRAINNHFPIESGALVSTNLYDPDAEVFLPAKELDVPPFPLTEPPQYAELFFDYPFAGKLTIDLWVDETGKVLSVKLVDAMMPEFLDGRIGVEFSRIPFSPGQKSELPVKARVRMELIYLPSEAPATKPKIDRLGVLQ